jgi:hypothetical protein
MAALVAGPAPTVSRRAEIVVALRTRSLATLRRFFRWRQMLQMMELPTRVLRRTVPRGEPGAWRMVGLGPPTARRVLGDSDRFGLRMVGAAVGLALRMPMEWLPAP